MYIVQEVIAPIHAWISSRRWVLPPREEFARNRRPVWEMVHTPEQNIRAGPL